MEYTQAYQFIAKPVALNDVSKEKEKIVGGEEVKESSAKAVSANTEKESNCFCSTFNSTYYILDFEIL